MDGIKLFIRDTLENAMPRQINNWKIKLGKKKLKQTADYDKNIPFSARSRQEQYDRWGHRDTEAH